MIETWRDEEFVGPPTLSDLACRLAWELEATQRKLRQKARELEVIKAELGGSYDAFVAAERAIFDVLRRSSQREYANARNERLRAAGSCISCGAEAHPGRIRCTPCGQKNSAPTKRRRRAA